MNTILSRRSIRKYTHEDVPADQISSILKAAMSAPSAGNQQPWSFVVVRNKEVLKALEDAHPYAKMTTSAPVAIVVCGDKTGCKYPDFWIQDCSAAIENILLAVNDLGLGAVWCGVYPEEDRAAAFGAILHLPDSVIPVAHIPIGHCDEEKGPSERFNVERIHYDRW